MQRIPFILFNNVQLTTSLAGATVTAPNASYVTISAATFNNTTAIPHTVTIHLVPSGGTAGASNQLGTTVAVPVAGSAPTIGSWLIGHTLSPGMSLQMLADLGSAVSVFVSGYQTTL